MNIYIASKGYKNRQLEIVRDSWSIKNPEFFATDFDKSFYAFSGIFMYIFVSHCLILPFLIPFI